MSASDLENRVHEAAAVTAYLRICDAWLAGNYFRARHRGECALTHATIRPDIQIVAVGDDAFVRRDAAKVIDIRDNDTVETVLNRFGWANRELAAKWAAEGSLVLLFSAAMLKPTAVTRDRRGSSMTLDEVRTLQWRSVAFMVRRQESSQ